MEATRRVPSHDFPDVEIDEVRTSALLRLFLEAIRTHLGGVPPRRELVLEALNALGVAAATVVYGAGPSGAEACIGFLMETFTEQLNSFSEAGRARGDSDLH